jgi:putative SOS response-associated peptidase YedK
MCGFVERPSAKKAVKELKLKIKEDFEGVKRLAPTMQMAVIDDIDSAELKLFSWGVIPAFADNFKLTYATFNAKSENLFNSPIWKQLVGKKHCVLVCEQFYEWQYQDPKKKKGPQIYAIKAANQELTLMAGLWEQWVNKETGEIKYSCTMLTNPANDLMAQIHNTKARMPAFLTFDNYQLWLAKDISVKDRLELIAPVANDFLIATPIDKIEW